jgi:Ca-activated chloride channel family protein
MSFAIPGSTTAYRRHRKYGPHICVLLAIILAGLHTTVHGQTNLLLNQGNKLYEQQKYKEAEADYAKALTRDPTNTSGLFNLGNSLYQQKQFDSSRKIMAATANVVKDKNGKAAANYNIGNTYMSQQKWEDAANAYKQTLRANPQDGDAKYNLSYAEEMMKKQQQQNKDKDKKKQDKQNKDQKDKDQQNKDQQKKDDKQDKGNGDKDKKDDQKQDQQPQAQPGKLSEQQAEQLLNALQQEEKKLQDKMKKEKGVPVKMEKDW